MKARGWGSKSEGWQSARGLAQSKTLRNFVALLTVLGVGLCAIAQNYSIDWYKISGGGGTATGGVYAVSGTIGQPDASSAMSGEQYSITGGYWSLLAVVQTAGLPNLCIAHSGHNVIVSWPNTANCTLQTNNNLAAASGWDAYSGTVNTASGTNSITISAPAGKLFFRLSQP